MAQYRVRYVTYAAEQLAQLPRSMRAAFDAKVSDLERDPYTGIILYTFSDLYTVSGGNVMVTILRVTWFEW